MNKPSVAVVILNWNGKSLLEKFLPSVVQTVYPNLQIIVGDNHSTDDSISFLEANYPNIRIVENDRNYGFAGGYNKILDQVSADYFVLLNSDVEVTPEWIDPVISIMETDSLIVAAQPKIKSYQNKDAFEYAGAAGGFLDVFGFPFCRGRLFDTVEADKGQYNEYSEVFWASGAAFFIKSSHWKTVGGLDEQLFAHMEEIDLCWRLKNKGFKIVYCPNSTVYHVGGGTLDALNPHKTYLNFRNNLLIMQKNLPSDEAFKYIFIRFFIDFIAWLKFLIEGKPKFSLAITSAHWYFVKQVFSKKSFSPAKPIKMHVGVFKKSIVYSYFGKGIQYFNQLPKDEINT